MQICYRCEEKTNERLEKMAKKNGISKNHLIDEIVKEHLTEGRKNNPIFHFSLSEPELLSAIQHANELLAQLLEELVKISIDISNNPITDAFPDNPGNTSQSVNDSSFSTFYAQVIQLLLEISETLELICKNKHLMK